MFTQQSTTDMWLLSKNRKMSKFHKTQNEMFEAEADSKTTIKYVEKMAKQNYCQWYVNNFTPDYSDCPSFKDLPTTQTVITLKDQPLRLFQKIKKSKFRKNSNISSARNFKTVGKSSTNYHPGYATAVDMVLDLNVESLYAENKRRKSAHSSSSSQSSKFKDSGCQTGDQTSANNTGDKNSYYGDEFSTALEMFLKLDIDEIVSWKTLKVAGKKNETNNESNTCIKQNSFRIRDRGTSVTSSKVSDENQIQPKTKNVRFSGGQTETFSKSSKNGTCKEFDNQVGPSALKTVMARNNLDFFAYSRVVRKSV